MHSWDSQGLNPCDCTTCTAAARVVQTTHVLVPPPRSSQVSEDDENGRRKYAPLAELTRPLPIGCAPSCAEPDRLRCIIHRYAPITDWKTRRSLPSGPRVVTRIKSVGKDRSWDSDHGRGKRAYPEPHRTQWPACTQIPACAQCSVRHSNRCTVLQARTCRWRSGRSANDHS